MTDPVCIFKILFVALLLILNHQKRKFITELTLDSLVVSKVRQETKLRKTRWLAILYTPEYTCSHVYYFLGENPAFTILFGLKTVHKKAYTFITVVCKQVQKISFLVHSKWQLSSFSSAKFSRYYCFKMENLKFAKFPYICVYFYRAEKAWF